MAIPAISKVKAHLGSNGMAYTAVGASRAAALIWIIPVEASASPGLAERFHHRRNAGCCQILILIQRGDRPPRLGLGLSIL